MLRQNKNKVKNKWKVLIATIITILLLFYLIENVELSAIYQSLALLNVKIILIGLIFYMFSYVFRAIRFKLILGESIKLFSLLWIVCIHNFFVQLLPARIGEISYLYLIKKYGIDKNKNIASIAFARIFDVIIVAVFFFMGLTSIPELLPDFIILLIIVIAVLLLLFLILYYLIFRQSMVLLMLEWIIRRTNINILKRGIDKFKEVVYEFGSLKSRRLTIGLFISSIFIWGTLYLFMYVFLNAFFNEITIPNAFLIVTLPVIFSILPIYGVAGFGTTETAFLFALLWFNENLELAISAGFVIHGFQLLFFITFGLVGAAFFMFDPYRIRYDKM